MKRYIFGIWILFPVASFAQLKAIKSPMPFVYGGWVLANQHIRSQQSSFEYLNGFQLGIGIQKPITQRFALAALGGFMRAGSNNTRFFNYSERIDYLTLSVRAIEYLPVGGSDLYLSLAPQLGIGVQSKRLSTSGQIIEEDFLSSDGYTNTDFGLQAAIGIKFPFGTWVEAGWYSGFANVYKKNLWRVYNTSLQITAGQTIGWSRFKQKRRS